MKAAKRSAIAGAFLVTWMVLSLTVQSLILFRLRHLEDPHQVVFTIPQINSSAQEIGSCQN